MITLRSHQGHFEINGREVPREVFEAFGKLRMTVFGSDVDESSRLEALLKSKELSHEALRHLLWEAVQSRAHLVEPNLLAEIILDAWQYDTPTTSTMFFDLYKLSDKTKKAAFTILRPVINDESYPAKLRFSLAGMFNHLDHLEELENLLKDAKGEEAAQLWLSLNMSRACLRLYDAAPSYVPPSVPPVPEGQRKYLLEKLMSVAPHQTTALENELRSGTGFRSFSNSWSEGLRAMLPTLLNDMTGHEV